MDSSEPKRVKLEALSTTLYEHMKAKGAALMQGERAGHTLTPTALVHEAFARLADSDQRQFNDRAHLLAAAALAMRRILIEHARARGRQKRQGERKRVDWDAVAHAVSERSDPDTLIDLDDALHRMGAEEGELGKRYVRMIELRLFGAMTNQEIASVLDVSLATVEKDMRYVKAKLQALLNPSP